ncbi:MAG TPA: cation-transporting P-type ATPase, partial [Methanomicrobiales archaeon]|nr:cation-transporting P-type ATPase [Methanomicrobiales archaeon]
MADRESRSYCSCTLCREGVCPIHQPLLDRRTVVLLGLSAALLAAGILVDTFPPYPLVGLALLIAAALLSGYEILRTGLLALLHLQFTIDTLILIAAVGAFLTGNPEEGASVVFLYAIAEILEEYASGRAQRTVA